MLFVEIKRALIGGDVKVCRGFIWERRGVCQWNGRVKFNRAGVRSRRDAEKSGREPF